MITEKPFVGVEVEGSKIGEDSIFIPCNSIKSITHFKDILTKYNFIKRCYELDKPFALLMPLTALEGIERGRLYMEYGLQLIIPNRRINFITPNRGKSSWFATAWFTHKLDLPKDMMFVEMER